MKRYMGIDQYNTIYHGLLNPRKDLLKRLCATKAQKMYVDTVSGKAFHVGYIIKGLWIEIFEVAPFRKEVKS